MHYSIIVFPGSNCDKDCADAVLIDTDNSYDFVWHQKPLLPKTDCVIIPGGFTYGDYLRAGAIAKTAPIIQDVIRFANDGGLVLGICNGFQILTEAKLLPGALIRNNNLKFVCKDVCLRVENNITPFTNQCEMFSVLKMPIAHFEGSYYIDEENYHKILSDNQIVLKYSNSQGSCIDDANPNGSRYNIAGVCNQHFNVFGLMPHPERSIDLFLGGNDGLKIFRSIKQFVAKKTKVYS